jgi:hypothetical protein
VVEVEALAAEAEALVDHARCTKQYVRIADKKLKFLSSQLKEDLFTAEIVFRNIERIEWRVSDNRKFVKFFIFLNFSKESEFSLKNYNLLCLCFFFVLWLPEELSW